MPHKDFFFRHLYADQTGVCHWQVSNSFYYVSPNGLQAYFQEGNLTPGNTRRAFNAVAAKFTTTSKLIRGRLDAIVRRAADGHNCLRLPSFPASLPVIRLALLAVRRPSFPTRCEHHYHA
jgi:hypothetical protein